MKRKNFGRDRGLSLRMLFTGGLLGLLYVGFAVVLFNVLNFGLAPMLVIVIGLAVLPVLDLRQARARGVRGEDRHRARRRRSCTRWSSGSARWPTCRSRASRSSTDVPNAFATGRNPKHAAVAVTTGLWRRLEPQEIEAVLAHELSHIANRDVLVMTVASFFAMLAAMITRFGLYSGMFGGFGGGRSSNNNNQASRLADRPPRLDRRLRDQLHPDPDDLALPRVRGRPRLGAHHRRAREPHERAPEDLERHHADPAARPARGRRG